MWPENRKAAAHRYNLSMADLAALFDAEPIEPKHEPPRDLASAGISSLVTPADEAFFEDFRAFSVIANARYLHRGPWRLRETPQVLVGRGQDPEHGRSYALFHNRYRIGQLELSAGLDIRGPGFKTYSDAPFVSASLGIECPTAIPYVSVQALLGVLRSLTVSPDARAQADCIRAMDQALLGSLWDAVGQGDYRALLEVEWHGEPSSFLRVRDVLLEQMGKARARPA